MKFLLFTHEHALLPVAHKLTLEGHDVDLYTWKPRFEKAWAGKLPRALPSRQWRKPRKGGKGLTVDTEALAPALEAAASGASVLHDFPWAESPFGRGNVYGVLKPEVEPLATLRVGGWFDGTHLVCPHWLVVDMGAWPGGMGAQVPGGLTLIRAEFPPAFADALETFESELKAREFRGLVQVGLELAMGELKPAGIRAGWPFLHWHAFLSEIGNLGAVLGGETPVLPKKYVTVLPVTIPPWPGPSDRPAEVVAIQGLTTKRQGQIFWHDVEIHSESQSLRSAGLDGLVAVVPGSADTMSLSRAYALEVASQIQLPQKQLRSDVGSQVDPVLALLESSFGWVL